MIALYSIVLACNTIHYIILLQTKQNIFETTLAAFKVACLGSES